ncbi:hypothetical protein FQN50_008322 [Emmonsiellopsis sp. PD_5]|nr:hypothetical protein FQN50_008322 [Emmonsiellopsis sp. PD_5]
MKLTTILTATLALAAAPLSSAWHLQLYKNQNYKGEIHDREGTMGQDCRNLAARHKNQVESMHWDSGHWVTECRVRLYNKDNCAGNSMANSGYGSWHIPAFSKKARNKLEDTSMAPKQYVQANRKNDDKVIPTLLALLEWLPDEGKTSFARDILDTSDNDDDLHAVFWNLVCGLLSPMKTTRGKTSVSSSPREMKENDEEVVGSSLPVPQSRDHKFRETCLRRDDYRCVVTRRMDTQRWEDLGCPSDVPFGDLEAAHIIPSVYASWNDHLTSPPMNVSKAWELLYRYFPTIKRVGVSVENINDPSNGIMLRGHIHSEFGKFRCAFVATETPHVYTLKTFPSFPSDFFHFLPTDRIVTMQQAVGAEDVDLPLPVILDCHHRIAEILNASGMGEVIEKLMREWEDVKTYGGHGSLDPLGRSDVSRILETALWQRITKLLAGSSYVEAFEENQVPEQGISTFTPHSEMTKISPR